ncbi:hypothetical protein HK101_005406 [Irineochytrium annulatum]|nr:hypothetical protein HK101_005406 [Irineochytrium annulatum]
MDRDARIQALDRKLDDMAKATRTAVSNACSNLQQQHDDLMKKYAALTKTLDDRVRQQDALQRSHAELAEREADIRTEHEELKRKHVEACRRAEDCQKMYDDRTRIVKVLSGEIEDLTRAKAEIAAALEQAADCDLPDRHDELTREHEELRGMFDVLTRDHEKLKHGLMDALRMEPGEVLQTGDLVLRACLMKSETAEVAKQRDELERAAAALASELADVKFTSAQFEDIERTQEVVLGGVIQEELKVREELKALKKTYDTHVSTSASSARDSASLLAKKDDDLRRLRERVARDTAFVEEGFTELKNRRVELAQRHAELGKRHAELVKGHARVVEERDALAREVETIERAFEAGAYLVYPET